MFRWVRKAMCAAGVLTTLKKTGVAPGFAQSLVDEHMPYFDATAHELRHLATQPRNIIAMIGLLHLVTKALQDVDDENLVLDILSLQKALRLGYEMLKYQLKTRQNWLQIAQGYNITLHLFLREKMMSEEELIETFEPSKLEFDHDLLESWR
ncbi:hypothetical protein SAMN04488136_13021 [Vibrio xiamenensis]|uniref:Uncharacterized protein n=1 Tax=Vibrio xiamenensis TaxID=861298 RepID=A0A1G8FED7_9VIBR|nr:hypothetical protein [Vibrio xiamenensis]SDH80541.1 hypothetical protein SAMN04488136_13021 [Vibrio xiamenensis]